ncbi:MAG: hypothetical protein LBL37_01970 [Gracilibacteraceae bacterium]|jgi:hypothetical protein|nr:hypothetical protein [Gracilibacteraceae bacterium]
MKTFTQTINGSVYSAGAEIGGEDNLLPEIHRLFEVIAGIAPEEIHDGFTIEVNFTVFTLLKKTDGFSVSAPDYGKNPHADRTEDLTQALRIQSRQTNLLRRYGIDGEPTRFDDKIIADKGAVKEREIYFMRTAERSKGDSGWYIKSKARNAKSAAESYEAFYAWQLLALRPAVIGALAFPHDYIAVFDGDEIRAIVNPDNEDIMDLTLTE